MYRNNTKTEAQMQNNEFSKYLNLFPMRKEELQSLKGRFNLPSVKRKQQVLNRYRLAEGRNEFSRRVGRNAVKSTGRVRIPNFPRPRPRKNKSGVNRNALRNAIRIIGQDKQGSYIYRLI